METYPIHDEDNNLVAFEIENAYVRPARIAEFLSADGGVADIRLRRIFSGDDELRLTFRYSGIPFVVAEPFGDSSRYWVGPEGELSKDLSNHLGKLEEIFKAYQPSFPVRLIGDLVTLKFLKFMR